jgi:hypothetical protein
MKLPMSSNAAPSMEEVKQIVDTSVRAFDVKEMKEVSLKDISARLVISDVKNMGIDYYLDFKRYQGLFALFARGEVTENNTDRLDIAMCLYGSIFLQGAIGPQNKAERKYLDASLSSIYKNQIIVSDSAIQIKEGHRAALTNMEPGLFIESELQYSPIIVQKGKMLVYKNMQFGERITCPIRYYTFHNIPSEFSLSKYTYSTGNYTTLMAMGAGCREDISNWYKYLQGNYIATVVLDGLERKVHFGKMGTGQISHKILDRDVEWMNLIEKIGPYTKCNDNQRAISDADMSSRNGIIKVEKGTFDLSIGREYYYFRGAEHIKKQLGWQLGFHFRIQDNLSYNVMYLEWEGIRWKMCYCGMNVFGVILDMEAIGRMKVNPFAVTGDGLKGIVLLPEFLLGIYREKESNKA